MKLTAQQIVEKEFKKSMKGYHVDEVDTFLNDIIEDYEAFEGQLVALKEENARLKKELEMAQIQATQVRKPAVQATTSTTNYDILQRLSNLEKHVFGSKLSE
jgi:DivIVA domain-containing protein